MIMMPLGVVVRARERQHRTWQGQPLCLSA